MAGCAAYGPAHHGEKIHRNVVFASPGGRDLHLDLYVPASPKPAPVAVWIFGGSWMFGSKGYHVNVRDLTQHGIAVASIQYRLSGEAIYPAQLEDCQAALHWLQKNGPRYGLDPRRIALTGESAGGHLAALLGTVEGRSQVRAVFAMYPPTDIVKIGRQYASPERPSAMERLLGGPIETKLPAARAASPVNHVSSKSPPFLFVHGDKDTLVSIEHSRDLHQRLRHAGVESHLIVVPGKEHWFQLTPEQLATVAKFLNAHLR